MSLVEKKKKTLITSKNKANSFTDQEYNHSFNETPRIYLELW